MRLDSEKRNLKLGLQAEVKLTTFVRTENCQTENYFWSENFTEKCRQTKFRQTEILKLLR